MGTFSIGHWVVVLVVILIVFGAGKLPAVAADLAKGLKSFRRGLREDEAAPGEAPNPSSDDDRTPARR